MKISIDIYSQRDRAEIKSKYEDILTTITHMLVDSSSNLKFFGHFFMSLNKKILFLDEVGVWNKLANLESGLVYIEGDDLTIVVDPELLFDKFIVFKLLFKILHEILHNVLQHNNRKPTSMKEAVIYNLAADHQVNATIRNLYENSTISKVIYFPKKEFFIERWYSKAFDLSTKDIFSLILTSKEFDVNAKKIVIPMVPPEMKQLMLDNNQKLPPIIIEDIMTLDDIEYNMAITTKNIKLNLSQNDVNTEQYKNSDVDEDSYISNKYNTFFKQEVNDLPKDDIDNIEDKIDSNIDSIINASKQNNVEIEHQESSDDEMSSDMQMMSLDDPIPTLSFIIIHVHDKVTKLSYQVIYDLSNNSDGAGQISGQAPLLYDMYKESLQKAFGDRQRGHGSGNALSLFDSLFEVDYPWEEVLKNAIATRTQQSDETSYTKINYYKNGISDNIRFPGNLDRLVPEILCAAIDSSGSMSDEDLKQIISILCDSHSKFTELVVFVHDYTVVDTIIIKDAFSEDEIFNKLSKIQGRGGTSHKDVFEKIEELSEEKILSVVMFFTDFDSDVSYIYNDYEFLRNNETIWCISGKGKDFVVDLPVPTQTINMTEVFN